MNIFPFSMASAEFHRRLVILPLLGVQETYCLEHRLSWRCPILSGNKEHKRKGLLFKCAEGVQSHTAITRSKSKAEFLMIAARGGVLDLNG